MPGNRLTPVTRNKMFYGEDDFLLETDMAAEYLEGDTNQTIVLYEVDRIKTNSDSVYKESDEGSIRFKAPKEIPCLYEIKEPQMKSYEKQNNNGVYQLAGNLSVYVMTKTLDKYRCDIKRGDYIGVLVDTNRMAYFVVTNDGKVNIANITHIGAYKPAWRVVEATPCDTEFKGI
jgi:hypothetical protein